MEKQAPLPGNPACTHRPKIKVHTVGFDRAVFISGAKDRRFSRSPAHTLFRMKSVSVPKGGLDVGGSFPVEVGAGDPGVVGIAFFEGVRAGRFDVLKPGIEPEILIGIAPDVRLGDFHQVLEDFGFVAIFAERFRQIVGVGVDPPVLMERVPENGSVLDLGTGSGAIALALAYERPDAVVTAVDISPGALAIALHNAEKLDLTRVRFLESDLFAALEGETFDLIAANLPYVTDEEYDELEPEVRIHEPRLALTAPDSGFALISRAAEEAPRYLNPGGSVIFELSPAQVPRLATQLARSGAFEEIISKQDYTRRERFVTARRKHRGTVR